MQLGTGPAPLPPGGDLAAALAVRARDLGHRPAVTVLRAGGVRAEQGYASLAQWAAKGAHLLDLEQGLGPGDRVGVDGPADWMAAAVALAAWWAGCTVVVEGDAEVVVRHASRAGGRVHADEVYAWDDTVDGATDPTLPGTEAWAVAVQAFPDQPPAPRAAPDVVAVTSGDASRTHADLVAQLAPAVPATAGALRLHDATDPLAALLAVAARPVVVGRATVVLDGVDDEAAAGEGRLTWL
ncbi:MAG: hypothetical protein ACLGIR_11970 [Actinomycetes bacterium]